MKTQQLQLMPGKQGLNGMAHGAKRVLVLALICVFSYTTFAQNLRTVSYTGTFNAGDIKDNLLGVIIKGSDFTANGFTVVCNGEEKPVSARSIIIKGDYVLATLDISNVDPSSITMIKDGSNNHTPINVNTFRLNVTGTRKEITIDNVSGVIADDDQGTASIVVIDYTKLTAVYDGTISTPTLIGTPNGGGSNNGNTNGGSREDDIITKDEVQGYVSAYPNPARGSVKIKTTHSRLTITEITMISAIGSKVTTQRADDGDGRLVTIDTQNIPAGIYFLSVKTNMGDIVKRIVVVD